jgi:hypothetical protein
MPRGIPRDPALYAAAAARVRAGVRHRILPETVDWKAKTGSCVACGAGSTIYLNNTYPHCANYYTDSEVRKQLTAQGERLPRLKKGRMRSGEIPPVVEIPLLEQYVPWNDNATPPPGFDPTEFTRTEELTSRIASYTVAQRKAQRNRCFCCGEKMRVMHIGGGQTRDEFGFARIRQPRGETQVVIMDELFCTSCLRIIESLSGNTEAFVLRVAQVLGHGRRHLTAPPVAHSVHEPTIKEKLMQGLAASLVPIQTDSTAE